MSNQFKLTKFFVTDNDLDKFLFKNIIFAVSKLCLVDFTEFVL